MDDENILDGSPVSDLDSEPDDQEVTLDDIKTSIEAVEESVHDVSSAGIL